MQMRSCAKLKSHTFAQMIPWGWNTPPPHIVVNFQFNICVSSLENKQFICDTFLKLIIWFPTAYISVCNIRGGIREIIYPNVKIVFLITLLDNRIGQYFDSPTVKNYLFRQNLKNWTVLLKFKKKLFHNYMVLNTIIEFLHTLLFYKLQ